MENVLEKWQGVQTFRQNDEELSESNSVRLLCQTTQEYRIVFSFFILWNTIILRLLPVDWSTLNKPKQKRKLVTLHIFYFFCFRHFISFSSSADETTTFRPCRFYLLSQSSVACWCLLDFHCFTYWNCQLSEYFTLCSFSLLIELLFSIYLPSSRPFRCL